MGVQPQVGALPCVGGGLVCRTLGCLLCLAGLRFCVKCERVPLQTCMAPLYPLLAATARGRVRLDRVPFVCALALHAGY